MGGDFSGALADYNRAININPDYAICYVDRGILKSKMGEPHDASLDFIKAVKLDPQMKEKIEAKGYSAK